MNHATVNWNITSAAHLHLIYRHHYQLQCIVNDTAANACKISAPRHANLARERETTLSFFPATWLTFCCVTLVIFCRVLNNSTCVPPICCKCAQLWSANEVIIALYCPARSPLLHSHRENQLVCPTLWYFIIVY